MVVEAISVRLNLLSLSRFSPSADRVRTRVWRDLKEEKRGKDLNNLAFEKNDSCSLQHK